MEYQDHEGNRRQVTAENLCRMEATQRLATLEALQLKAIRYTTVTIENLRAGDWIVTRDQHDAEGPSEGNQVNPNASRNGCQN